MLMDSSASSSPSPGGPLSSGSPSVPAFTLAAGKLAAGRLRVLSFRGREAVSRPYRFDVAVTVAGADAHDLEAQILAQPAVLAMQVPGGEPRAVCGIVAAVEAEDAFAAGHHELRLRIVPRLWLLAKRKTSRVFQNLSVPAIVAAVLDGAKVPHRAALVEKYPARLYCVQYQETDLAFVTRLLAEEGIFYFFEHAREETVVLCDSAHLYAPIAGDASLAYRSERGESLGHLEHHVGPFTLRRALEPGAALHRDYDFRRPMLDLRADAKPPSSAPPASTAGEGASPFEAEQLRVYDHQGADELPDVDAGTARVRLEQRRRRASEARGESACRRLVPGFRFDLVDHALDALNRSYVVASVRHEGRAPDVTRNGERVYANSFACVPAEVALRPKRPRRVLQQVTETALVVGPEGEEIHTDEHGRVRVQFPWDLEGKKNEHSSCWVRVAQAWAGPGWGFQFVPRIGMEVVVTFVGGDTDRPLVTGCVPNALNVPPFALPASKTKSGIRTRSTPKGQGHNELSFEDRKGAELVHLHAERDLDEKVNRNHTSAIGHNKRLTVGACLDEHVEQDHATTVQGDRRESVRGAAMFSAGGDRTASVGKNDVRHVAGNDCAIVTGNAVRQIAGTVAEHVQHGYALAVREHYELQVGTHDAPRHAIVYVSGNHRIVAGQDAVVHAERSLTLACGKSTITLTPEGIIIKAPSVTVEGGAVSMKGKGPEVRVGDKVEIISDRILLQAKEATIDLEHDARIDAKLVKLNCGPDRVKRDGEGAGDEQHAVIQVVHHMAGTPCERMKVTVADAKGKTREYVTAPDGTIRIEFGPEEKSGALRIVGMRHADDEDRTIHMTDIGRS
jgi:type VI secretion system secreted protein VgrG